MDDQEEKKEGIQKELIVEDFDRLISRTNTRISALKKVLKGLDEDKRKSRPETK
ncbi:MAG: hypothetical protein MI866_04535 [Bacteroidales bacterium]|nr:hypothetical protein [Bacteroidales bacterium]